MLFREHTLVSNDVCTFLIEEKRNNIILEKKEKGQHKSINQKNLQKGESRSKKEKSNTPPL